MASSISSRPSLVALAVAAGLLAAPAAYAISINVKIESLAPANGNFLTPVWVGFHDGSFDVYDTGSPASAALERLAEDGNTAPVSAAFLSSGAGTTDATIAGPGGPLAPGDTATMSFNLDGSLATSRFFSYASMVIPSNDAFIANGNPLTHEIFDAGGNFLGADFIVLGSAVRDAGTEVNDEVPANTAFLGQVVPDTGVPENGVVQIHPGFLAGGNILTAYPGADFTLPGYQVARITVTRATPAAIPEPATIALFAIGLPVITGIGYHRRRGARNEA